ncbi:MAG TPA: peptidyl-prolyl cis-trans isomerase [Candidatus Hydrogenedentes bacterium]|nr:peptidyl-prolyl cis-trans isomerase [Candidatus Hydrogenedentota bacterium]
MRSRFYKVTLWVIIILVGLSFAAAGTLNRFLSRKKPDQALLDTVASVGDIPITLRELGMGIRAEVEQRARRGESPDAEALAPLVLDAFITRALLSWKANQRHLRFEDGYVDERLKSSEDFLDEQGVFDAGRWNKFVESPLDWNAVRQQQSERIRMEILDRVISASARVLYSEVREVFEQKYTKISVKYALIQPALEPTDEQIQKHYEENKEQYQTAAERVAEFVAISLKGERPPLADELVNRARAGEDFAELAKEFSAAPNAANGGALDWVVQRPTLPAHQAILFELPVDGVSDPIEGPSGYYIYKVEEERSSEIDEVRSVRARQILLRSSLDAETRQARVDQATAVAEQARQQGDLAGAAADAGLELRVSGRFSRGSISIEHVAPEDAFSFRNRLTQLDLGAISDAVMARSNVYVAEVIEVVPPKDRAIEEVRDDVIADTMAALRMEPEYLEEVARICDEIAENAQSIDDIKTLFPDLELEVTESNDFSLKEPDFRSGIFVRPQHVFAAVGWGEPGTFGGPLMDYAGKTYFVELMTKNPPAETVWEENFASEEESIRRSLRMARGTARRQDYLTDLRRRAEMAGVINVDIEKLLGTEEDADRAGGEPSRDTTAAAQAETEPVEQAPAASTEEEPTPQDL